MEVSNVTGMLRMLGRNLVMVNPGEHHEVLRKWKCILKGLRSSCCLSIQDRMNELLHTMTMFEEDWEDPDNEREQVNRIVAQIDGLIKYVCFQFSFYDSLST